MISPEVLGLLLVVATAGIAFASYLLVRPADGLLLMFGIALLIERFPFHNVATAHPMVYDNLNATLGIGGLFINPVEIILGLVAAGWALRALVEPNQKLYIQTISLLGVAYGGWMVVSVLWGFVNGGNWKVALWILRPVVYFLSIAFLTFQILKTPSEVKRFVIVLVVCVTIKSFQIILRKFDLPPDLQAYGEHEDTGFALAAFWMAIGAVFLPIPKPLKWFLWLTLPILGLGIVYNDRRINLATGILGMMAIPLLQSRGRLWQLRTPLMLAGIVAFLYIVVGWFGPTNPVTAPVKGFKEGIRAEVYGDNTDNSSFYRKVERFNLRHTIRQNPVMGTGLGVKYLQIITLDQLSFEYFVYIPHNQVLLVHSATGTIGYTIFLLFFAALITQMTIYYRYLHVGWQRLLALVALLSIMNWLMVGYYDLQLFFYRNSMVMGILVALPAVLYRHQLLKEKEPEE